MQVSTFSQATDFEQYHTNLTMSFSEQEDFVKDFIMRWSGCGIKSFY